MSTANGVAAWRGIFPSLCTPFHTDDRVDVDGQRAVVAFALEQGAHGLVCFGLAGEVARLSVEERVQLTRLIVDETASRVPVLIGVGAESLRQTRHLARQAEQAGADGIVVPPPTGVQLSATDLARYLADVASTVQLPVMVQDAGAYLGVSLSPEIVLGAAEVSDNICLVKVEAGPVEMQHWIAALGPRFQVYGGDGGMYQRDCLRLGAAGIVPGVEVVDLLVRIYEADAAGDEQAASERFGELLPLLLFEMQSIECYAACAKRILAWRGVLATTHLREPAPALPSQLDELLAHHVSALGLPVNV
jgi:4-hydroxy-tetrahydrodipicolinate synthase